MLQAPILHVNADDPEAVVQAARLAIGFRQRFQRDVMVDLWCYRRHGHNETDAPTFTQPRMYQGIAAHPSVVELYTRHLVATGQVSAEDVEPIRQEVRQRLDAARQVARQLRLRQRISTLKGLWTGLRRADGDWGADTAVAAEALRRVGEQAVRVPDGFAVHPKLMRVLAAWLDMVREKRPLDWSCAEMLTLGRHRRRQPRKRPLPHRRRQSPRQRRSPSMSRGSGGCR